MNKERRDENVMRDNKKKPTTLFLSLVSFPAPVRLLHQLHVPRVSGQHALVNTFIVRLAQCRLPESAPLNILRNGRAA